MEDGARASFDALLKELADPTRRAAAANLSSLSGAEGQDMAAFAGIWQVMDGQRRLTLVRELTDLIEDNVELNFDAVFLLALDDPDPNVRRTALEGLWEHEDRDLIDPLLRLLQDDPDAGVRADAALALGRFTLRAELDLLRASDARSIDGALQRTFNDPTQPAEVRARALESLGARSEEWAADLIEEAFASDDRRLRISAVHAMGRSADSAWLSSVLDQLESDDEEMRFEAATAVGAIADAEATPYLVPLLHDEDVEACMAAITALGQIGGDNAKEALQELLAEEDERFSEAITEALAEIEFAADPLAFELKE